MFARVLVLLEAPAETAGEDGVALVGAARDELVVGTEDRVAPRAVEVATAPPHRQHVEAGVDVELQLHQGCAVGL